MTHFNWINQNYWFPAWQSCLPEGRWWKKACWKRTQKDRNLQANHKDRARSEVPQKVPGGLCAPMSAEVPGKLSTELIINPPWHQLPEAKFQSETECPNEHVAGDLNSADTFLATNSPPCHGCLQLSNWAGAGHQVGSEIFFIMVTNICSALLDVMPTSKSSLSHLRWKPKKIQKLCIFRGLTAETETEITICLKKVQTPQGPLNSSSSLPHCSRACANMCPLPPPSFLWSLQKQRLHTFLSVRSKQLCRQKTFCTTEPLMVR